MWPFRPKPGLNRIAQELHELTLRVDKQEDRIIALAASYERLRGRFYATKQTEAAPPSADKASVLAAWRRGEIKP